MTTDEDRQAMVFAAAYAAIIMAGEGLSLAQTGACNAMLKYRNQVREMREGSGNGDDRQRELPRAQGRRAAAQGLSTDACPYAAGLDRGMWFEGYNEEAARP